MVGTNILQKYSDMLGLSTKAGVEIEEGTPQASNTYAVPSAIGQGNARYSTLNLARYCTTLATDGTVYDLTLIDKICDSSGNLIEENTANVSNQLSIDSSIWTTVRSGMTLAAETYSALNALGLKIAAKSGTAQEKKTESDHSLLITYAPYDDPEICTAMCIQHGYGSGTSIELTAKVYQIYYGLSQ